MMLGCYLQQYVVALVLPCVLLHRQHLWPIHCEITWVCCAQGLNWCLRPQLQHFKVSDCWLQLHLNQVNGSLWHRLPARSAVGNAKHNVLFKRCFCYSNGAHLSHVIADEVCRRAAL